MLTQTQLRQLLTYDAESGLFYRAVERRGPFKVGQRAGWRDRASGMWKVEIEGRPYLLHRLAWFYVHGEWPEQIDHINGNRDDNRLVNLRPADNSQNQANMKAKSNNRLGIRGVSFKNGSYIVQLKKNGVHFRGRFKSLDEATKFAVETSKRIHGEFSVHARGSDPRQQMAGM